jgi:hypothetical protein
MSSNVNSLSVQSRLVVLLLLAFVMQNGLHLIFLKFAPFEVIGSLLSSYLLIGLFGLMLFIAIVALAFLNKNQWKVCSFEYLNLNSINEVLKITVLISGVGLFFHCFSKGYVLSLYKVDCYSQVRFVWINADRTLFPTYVRIASVLGHFLSSFIYVGVVVSSMFYVVVNKNLEWRCHRFKSFVYLVVFLAFGLIYSLAIGSRNCALAFFIMSLAGVVLGIASQPLTIKPIVKAISVVAVAFSLTYGGTHIFTANRIFCGHDNTANKTKVIDNYNEGNIKQFPNLSIIEGVNSETYFWAKCSSCGTYFLYLNHAFINLATFMQSGERGNYELGKYFIDILERLHIISEKDSNLQPVRNFGPGFLPLAGAAYHDAGIWGVVWLLLFIVWILYLTLLGITSKTWSVFSLGVFVILFYALITSNLLTASNSMPFPFILLAFFCLGLYCSAKGYYKKTGAI